MANICVYDMDIRIYTFKFVKSMQKNVFKARHKVCDTDKIL